MNRTMSRLGSLALPALVLLGLPFVAPSAAQAEPTTTPYTTQPIIKLGDLAGNLLPPISTSYRVFVGPLSDTGQIAFGVGTSIQDAFYMGTYTGPRPGLLMQYADGKLTPIVTAGTEGPIGNWPQDVSFLWPFGMNQSGNVVFGAAKSGSRKLLGTFLWDAKAHKVTPLALRGMPAVYSMTFTEAGGFGPAINNRNEVALVASVKNPAGPSGQGLFYLGWDGSMMPVLLPGQVLPGGDKPRIGIFPAPSINDAGVVAFLARRQSDAQNSAYLWEQGTITPLVTVGTELPGGTISSVTGGKITSVSSVFVNNKNRNAVVTAAVDGSSRHGVYQVAAGKITPVAVPGQVMPGGGTLRTLQNVISLAYIPDNGTICLGCSTANQAGEHVLLATLDDNSTAAYRMNARGTLSLILKSGMNTNLGTITRVGVDSPASLNAKGQVALSVRINGSLPMLILMTPPAS